MARPPASPAPMAASRAFLTRSAPTYAIVEDNQHHAAQLYCLAVLACGTAAGRPRRLLHRVSAHLRAAPPVQSFINSKDTTQRVQSQLASVQRRRSPPTAPHFSVGANLRDNTDIKHNDGHCLWNMRTAQRCVRLLSGALRPDPPDPMPQGLCTLQQNVNCACAESWIGSSSDGIGLQNR